MAKRLTFAIAATVLVTMGLAGGASTAEAPQLDGAVQVTAAATPFRAYASPTLAVDRRRPDTLALATADTRSSQCSLQVSTNSGRSWTELPGPKVPDWPNCVRNTQGPIASLAFDREGTLYYAFVGWKPTDWHSRIFLARSEDLGRTFQVTALPGLEAHEDRGDIGSNALPAVVLDPTQPGRVYVSWSANYGLWNLDPLLPAGKTQNDFPRRAMLAASNDGGRTFGEPIDLGGNNRTSHAQPQLVVGKDGSVLPFSASGGASTSRPPSWLRTSTSSRPYPVTAGRRSTKGPSTRLRVATTTTS